MRGAASTVLYVIAGFQLVAAVVYAVTSLSLVRMLFVAAVEAVLVLALVRIARRLRDPEVMPASLEPRADRRLPVAPVPEADLAALPEPVRACPDCGYVGIRMPQLSDGVVPGGGELGDRIVCPRCGFQGLAVTFEKREDYGAFLRDLAAPS